MLHGGEPRPLYIRCRVGADMTAMVRLPACPPDYGRSTDASTKVSDRNCEVRHRNAGKPIVCSCDRSTRETPRAVVGRRLTC